MSDSEEDFGGCSPFPTHSGVSEKSIDKPPLFTPDPVLSGSREKRSHVSAEVPLSCCALCQGVLRNPVSTVCGHRFCGECITSHQHETASSGHFSCPQCGKKSRMELGDYSLLSVLHEHKNSLRQKYSCATEGTCEMRSGTPFDKIYTELYIIDNPREGAQTQHEVRQLETVFTKRKLSEASLQYCDIFKALNNQRIKVVLTNGVAGIGKTFLVQKFTLDWAKGLTNQDIKVVILFPLRELNLIRHEQHSLLTLLHVFHPALQKITPEHLSLCQLLFIFDGLDESRLSLDFNSAEVVNDITEKSSVNALLTNLISGNLLPSALVWITSRPVGATAIPPSCVDRVTELRGFTDVQIEEYFRRRFTDEELSVRAIHHIKKFSVLHIMCRIPLFCWITAAVLEHMSSTDPMGKMLPKTVTDLYSSFLLVQTKKKRLKYGQEPEVSPQELFRADEEVLLKLGRLAFEHLEKGSIMFYRDDLERVGLDVKNDVMTSGLCTQILKRECVLLQQPIYSFTHLSIQEFLAAIYLFHCYTTNNTSVLKDFLDEEDDDSFINDDEDDSEEYDSEEDDSEEYDSEEDDSEEDDSEEDDSEEDDSEEYDSEEYDSEEYDSEEDEPRPRQVPLDVFLKKALEKSIRSVSGHLDLLVRFLHGLSLKSNQRLLGGLLGQIDNSPEIIQRVCKNLKKMNTEDDNPDRSINIFHCLLEMNDFSTHEEIEEFLKSESASRKKLSAIQCSALALMLQMSEEVLEELNLQMYRASTEGRQRLIPAVRNCIRARLSGCELSPRHCEVVAEALSSEPSHLRELDLSANYLESSGAVLLSHGLESSNCKLEALWLDDCEITAPGCSLLGLALETNPFYLKTLDLSRNTLKDKGVEQLHGFLKSPHCILESLSLRRCSLSEHSCDILVSALQLNPSHLKYLELSNNKLLDVGVRKLFVFLLDTRFGLQTLKLENCGATHESCFSVAQVLKSNISHLRDLNLSNNKLNDLGLKLFCSGLKHPHCELEKLSLRGCQLSDASALVSALRSNPSHLGYLDLSENDLQDSEVTDFVENLCYKLDTLRISDADGSVIELSSSRRMNVGEQKGDDGQTSGPAAIQFREHLGDFSDEPGPSGILSDDRQKELASGKHRECDESTVNKDINEDGLTSGDPNDPGKMSQQVLTEPCTSEGDGAKPWLISSKVLYSLECPGPGVFTCDWTGLVFDMSQDAILKYNTVQWEEHDLQSYGLRAAGPLFNIECSEKAAVCELHLPHAETEDSPDLHDLVCVHITEGKFGVIRPLTVTDTHVVVRVPHLSLFGLAWHVKKLWHNRKRVRSQVLLFLRPPKPKSEKKKLNVFLLQSNIPVSEVIAQQLNAEYIQAPSKCKLIPEDTYSLQCPEALRVQPAEADFDTESGPNYHPTFEVKLPACTEEATVMIQDEVDEDMWKHVVSLTDGHPCEETFSSSCPKRKLESFRTQLVDKMSEENLKQLLDRLLEQEVINDEEKDSVLKESRCDGVRRVVDMVKKKGRNACSVFISTVWNLDKNLCKDIRLTP